MITNTSIGSYGRMGNMLYQMMAVIAIARKSRQDFGFEPIVNADHRDRFGSTEDVDLDNHFANRLPRIDNRYFEHKPVQWGYHDIYLPHGNWNLSGHFQSHKYFEHCYDEVRHWMTFKNEPESCDYIGLHWRSGDYTEGAHTYHPRQPIEYYQKAMAHFPNSKFLVFSDDIEGAKRLLGLGENFIYSEGNDYIQDFKLMKSCHSFICANSSYSLAAATLSNQPGKKIVCPSLWFGTAAGGLSTTDLYPENCIII